MSRIHPEDPRVTAHALGELAGADAAAIEKTAMMNPAVAEAIDETRQLAGFLQSTLGAQELTLDPARREAIRKAGRIPEPEKIVSMNRSRRWGRAAAVTGVAAALVAGAVWVMVKIPTDEREVVRADETALRRDVQLQVLLAPQPAPVPRGSTPRPSPGPSAAVLEGGVPAREVEREEYLALSRLINGDPASYFASVEKVARTADLDELRQLPPLIDHVFVSARDADRARVPLVSGTASFPMVERFVRGENTLPPRNTVRVEELINHLRYQDEGDAVFEGIRLGVELVRCPWDEETLLLGILLRNESDRPVPARANLELAIKPDMVRSYRLLGYADQAGGTIGKAPVPQSLGPGKSNYVLYELHPAKQSIFDEHWVILKAGLVIESDEEASPRGLISPVTSPPRDWIGASGNFQAASVLAAYGLLLRDSPYRGALDPSGLRGLAERAMKAVPDENLARREALQLVLDTLPLLEVGQ